LRKDAATAPYNHRLLRLSSEAMIRIALSDAAFEAIVSSLPRGSSRWPMQRDGDLCFIQVEAAVVDRMRAMRQPGESYSAVILRLIELEANEERSGCD
jgi:hypothetical protein